MRYLILVFAFSFFFNSSGKGQITCYAATLQVYEPYASVILSPKMQERKKATKTRTLHNLLKRSLPKNPLFDQQKKTVNSLGFISLASGIMAILLFVLTGLVSSGIIFFATLSLLFMGVAIITGIISLMKRKKLSDKKGTQKAPAIIGILLGGGYLLALIITFIYIAINGF